MNVFSQFRVVVTKALEAMKQKGQLPQDIDVTRVTCEPPKDASHGDISTNAAMVLAKHAGTNPRALATNLVEELKKDKNIESCEIAGPGFVNIRLNSAYWLNGLRTILGQGKNYGQANLGQGEKVNVEYVSVNPTGPMHVGHSRVAIVGDVLARLMEKVGYTVTREFYVNDAGAQIINLTRSAYARYRELHGYPLPESIQYPADYLIPVGQAISDQYGTSFLEEPEDVWFEAVRNLAVKMMLDLIKEDLHLLDIHHDIFRSERDVIEEGGLDAAYKELDEKGLIYIGRLPKPKGKVIDDWEPRDLTLFRSTEFGDDQDRALKKTDGAWTYIMGDIAYHRDKALRGYNKLINILGIDHVGYVKRIKAATTALTDGRVSLDFTLCALVKFMEEGDVLKMSKRAGTFVSVKEVIDRVGVDATRFMMMTRKNDIPIDFDFKKVVEKSKDNPVYYVQYAHARAHSIKRHVESTFEDMKTDLTSLQNADLGLLNTEAELAMIKTLASWPRQVELAAETQEPHRLAYFLSEIAAQFHGLWAMGRDDAQLRFIYPDDREKTHAKLALVLGVANVIASGLDIFGVMAVEEM